MFYLMRSSVRLLTSTLSGNTSRVVNLFPEDVPPHGFRLPVTTHCHWCRCAVACVRSREWHTTVTGVVTVVCHCYSPYPSVRVDFTRACVATCVLMMVSALLVAGALRRWKTHGTQLDVLPPVRRTASVQVPA